MRSIGSLRNRCSVHQRCGRLLILGQSKQNQGSDCLIVSVAYGGLRLNGFRRTHDEWSDELKLILIWAAVLMDLERRGVKISADVHISNFCYSDDIIVAIIVILPFFLLASAWT